MISDGHFWDVTGGWRRWKGTWVNLTELWVTSNTGDCKIHRLLLYTHLTKINIRSKSDNLLILLLSHRQTQQILLWCAETPSLPLVKPFWGLCGGVCLCTCVLSFLTVQYVNTRLTLRGSQGQRPFMAASSSPSYLTRGVSEAYNSWNAKTWKSHWSKTGSE